jgi:hypothetical protein
MTFVRSLQEIYQGSCYREANWKSPQKATELARRYAEFSQRALRIIEVFLCFLCAFAFSAPLREIKVRTEVTGKTEEEIESCLIIFLLCASASLREIKCSHRGLRANRGGNQISFFSFFTFPSLLPLRLCVKQFFAQGTPGTQRKSNRFYFFLLFTLLAQINKAGFSAFLHCSQ